MFIIYFFKPFNPLSPLAPFKPLKFLKIFVSKDLVFLLLFLYSFIAIVIASSNKSQYFLPIGSHK